MLFRSILLNITRDELRTILSKVNGVLLPGGMSSIVNPDPKDPNKLIYSAYTKMVKMIMEEAKAINDRGEYFPVFGVCLGFEAMILVEADDVNVVEKKDNGLGYNANLIYDTKRENSKFLSSVPQDLLDYMGRIKATHNYHEYMVDPDKFKENPNLSNTYQILSLSKSIDDKLTFISMIEGRKYPFYAFQYHPELAIATYYPDVEYPDSNMAAAFTRTMLWFMLTEAKKSYHSMDEEDMEKLFTKNPGDVLRDATFNVCYHLWE